MTEVDRISVKVLIRLNERRRAQVLAAHHARSLEIIDETCAKARERALAIAGDNALLQKEFLADVGAMRARLLVEAALHDAPGQVQ